ncbi:unnamed protein product [Gongylonema pulchrum]|uniref:Uncharacterized protein n=1 Tax=Gongylonema pulchrum TaxID=637853 RepID=A0A3P6RUF4_9BILA|nr:unnamed protein product [Gongylonema pulchrum]
MTIPAGPEQVEPEDLSRQSSPGNREREVRGLSMRCGALDYWPSAPWVEMNQLRMLNWQPSESIARYLAGTEETESTNSRAQFAHAATNDGERGQALWYPSQHVSQMSSPSHPQFDEGFRLAAQHSGQESRLRLSHSDQIPMPFMQHGGQAIQSSEDVPAHIRQPKKCCCCDVVFEQSYVTVSDGASSAQFVVGAS